MSLPVGLGVFVGCRARVCGAAQMLREDAVQGVVEMRNTHAGMTGERLKNERLG